MANPALPFIQENTVSEGSLDLMHYLHVLLNRKWSILFLGLLFGIWGLLGAMSLQPVYTAKLTLLLESEDSPILSMQDFYGSYGGSNDYIETEFGIIQSRSLAEKVVRKSQLHKHPYFNDAPEDNSFFDLSFLRPSNADNSGVDEVLSEEERIRNLIGFTASGIDVSGGDYSRIIQLSFTSGDADISVLLVNTYADVYVEDHLQAELESTQKATAWLSNRLQDLKSTLSKAEMRLQRFRDEEQLINLDGGVTSIGARELGDLSSRMAEARAKRLDLESVYKEISSNTRISVDELIAFPTVLNYGSIRDYKLAQVSVERRVAERAKRYGPKHPKMMALRSELLAAKQTLKSEVKKVVVGISRDYNAAVRVEETLASQLSDSKSSLQDINRKEFKLSELQREVETNQQLYDMFFQRARETTDNSGFTRAHARVLDPAEYAYASQASKLQMIFGAFLVGILLASGLVVLIDFLDYTISNPQEVQEKFQLPFLGVIPLVKTSKGKKIGGKSLDNYWKNTQSSFAESIRTIRTAVMLEGIDAPIKTIVITSTLPGEGKSTLALNLGAAIGQMEKVLVLGADLRRPTIAQKSGLDPKTNGLSNYLAGEAELTDVISFIDDAGIYVMHSGIAPPNPLEMLSSKKFQDLLEELKTQFDRIIIDSAPAHAVSDALVLASYADATIYVIKADETAEKMIRPNIKRMIDAGQSMTAIVLNNFDDSKASRYAGGGYYYDGYYSGYRPD